MKHMTAKLLKLSLTLTLAMSGMGYAVSASANAMFEALSSLTLTLSDVTTEDGRTRYGDDWSVYGELYYIDSGSFTNGDGIAGYDYNTGNVEMYLGDSVTQKTSAYGAAGVGIGDAHAFNGLDLYIENNAWENLVYTFDFDYLISAAVGSDTGLLGDDALSTASIDILDDFFSVDVLEEVTADLISGPNVDQLAYSGSFSFMLTPGDYNYLSAYSYSDGKSVGVSAVASAAVPEPSTLMLMGLSFVGFGATRLRKKA